MGPIAEFIATTLMFLGAAVITLWTAGAIHYDLLGGAKWNRWVALAWVVGVLAMCVTWQPLWQPFVALLAMAAVLFIVWRQQKPSQNRNWEPSVAVLARAVRTGDAVTIENVRNFDYRTLDDFTARYETRTYHLANLTAVDAIFFNWGSAIMSHPVLVFDFGPDGRACVSIEVRYRRGQKYSIVRSLFHSYELIFLVADERDAILRRTKFGPSQETHLYRLVTTPDELRATFLDYVDAINGLYQTPRWYHGLCMNCTTTFYRLPSRQRRCDWRVLANARLDRALYAAGRLDRTLPFPELRRIAYLNDIANSAPVDGFGDHIRRDLEGAAMNDDVSALLKVHEYFQGVSDDILQEVVRHARVVHHPAGTVVHEADVILTTIGFVLRGRLKAVRVNARGTESLFRMIERGEQFGMMVVALSEPVPVRVVALEPTTILTLDYEQAMELTFLHQELRRLWLKTYAGSMRKFFFGAAPKRAPMMLALIHESPATRMAAERLIKRLCAIGEKLAVFSDSDQWHKAPDIRVRALRTDGRELRADEIREQAAAWQDANRIIFDVHTYLTPERAVQLMELVDRAVYFIPTNDVDAAIRRLQSLDVPARGWRDKISVAWLLDQDNAVVPAIPNLSDFACRDFKIVETPRPLPWGKAQAGGLERLVHDLRGVRIGVALGGGAARGMSHLGVLKALEQSGIVVDMIAGTSAGAMTGILYSSGLDPDFNAHEFATALRPSWFFRQIPRGNHWYLLYKYRRGQFDPMLRKFLHEWRLEQLAVPCLSVTVDLVGGKSVVRATGDAVHAILESINLPVLSVPIVRNGQALIDGGLVNNIPADVLVSLGCNFVIAVSVTAKMETEFCNIKAEKPILSANRPGIVSTILRSLLVQNHNLNAFGVQPADVVIEPDVTGFDMTEFMRAEELAAVGEATALEQIPRIRQLLARLDPQLFGPSATT